MINAIDESKAEDEEDVKSTSRFAFEAETMDQTGVVSPNSK